MGHHAFMHNPGRGSWKIEETYKLRRGKKEK